MNPEMTVKITTAKIANPQTILLMNSTDVIPKNVLVKELGSCVLNIPKSTEPIILNIELKIIEIQKISIYISKTNLGPAYTTQQYRDG